MEKLKICRIQSKIASLWLQNSLMPVGGIFMIFLFIQNNFNLFE